MVEQFRDLRRIAAHHHCPEAFLSSPECDLMRLDAWHSLQHARSEDGIDGRTISPLDRDDGTSDADKEFKFSYVFDAMLNNGKQLKTST